MNSVFWQISTSLDGFMEGPNGELDRTAQVIDDDFEIYAGEMLSTIGGMILGRKTYEVFVDYWPTATGPDADRMNELPKLVFSRGGFDIGWKNARLATNGLRDEVEAFREEADGDIAVFGSADLASSLAAEGLIDEFRILVTPYLLGRGTPAFRVPPPVDRLQLCGVTPWSSGTVFLSYKPMAGL